MAIKTREQILSQLTSILGDNKTDDVIALIEDVTDTYSDLETKASGDGTDWKTKYEQNDKEWRDRYIARFNGKVDGDNGGNGNNNNGNNGGNDKVTTFDDLFKEGE